MDDPFPILEMRVKRSSRGTTPHSLGRILAQRTAFVEQESAASESALENGASFSPIRFQELRAKTIELFEDWGAFLTPCVRNDVLSRVRLR